MSAIAPCGFSAFKGRQITETNAINFRREIDGISFNHPKFKERTWNMGLEPLQKLNQARKQFTNFYQATTAATLITSVPKNE